jgi:hypothetical protein
MSRVRILLTCQLGGIDRSKITTPTTSRRPHLKPHQSAVNPKAFDSEKKEVKNFSRTEKPKEEKKFTISKTYRPIAQNKSPEKQNFKRKWFINRDNIS